MVSQVPSHPYFWDTVPVSNGTYTLESVATEVGGTTATSPGVTVTVSN